jgi:predicted dehydrogenase
MSDSTPSPVRVALVGLGGHGHTIQASTEAAPSLHVVTVYDPNEAEAQAAAARFGCPAADSYEAAIARDDLDAVVLVTPNHLHRAQTEAAVARGLDVFVEKPIANTVADGRAMIDAAAAAGRRLVVGHNLRFAPSMRTAKAALAEGALGDLVSVEIHFSSDSGTRLQDGMWRLRPDQCPLLPVMQLGVHALDLVHDIVGPIERVHALARSVVLPEGVVDGTSASFEVAGGAVGTMVSHYCTPVRFELRLTGTRGSVTSTLHDALLEPAGSTPRLLSFNDRTRESYDRQMDDFGRALQGVGFEGSDGWSGLQALAVVEAMQRSVDTRAVCDVERTQP